VEANRKHESIEEANDHKKNILKGLKRKNKEDKQNKNEKKANKRGRK